MTNLELLQGFGGAEDRYVLEAQRFRSGEKASGRRPRRRRFWLLVAAVIAAMALAIPAYGAIQRIQLRLTQRAEPTLQEEEILLTYYPQSLPEGYSLTGSSQTSSQSCNLLYENGEGKTIGFFISTGTYENDLVLRPPVEETEVDISGASGTLRVSGGGGQHLFWKNETVGYWASLFTEDTGVDLADMAKSVGPGEQLEVSPQYLEPDYRIKLHQEKGGYAGYEPMYPHTVPEGYEITFVSDRAYGEQVIRYENADGENLVFTLYFRLGEYNPGIEGMGEPEPVRVGGYDGYRVVSGQNQCVIWVDEERGFGFQLVGPAGLDLLAVAGSVAPGPELTPTHWDWTEKALAELGDYQITALPEGMTEDGLTGVPLEEGGGWYAYVHRWYFHKAENWEVFFGYETLIPGGDNPALGLVTGGREGLAQEITVNGCPGASRQLDDRAELAWTLEEADPSLAFTLSSPDLSVEELLELARSVAEK